MSEPIVKATTAAFVKRFGQGALDFRRKHGADMPPDVSEVSFCDGFSEGWHAALDAIGAQTNDDDLLATLRGMRGE